MGRRDSHDFIETFSALSRRIRSLAAQAYATFGVGSAQAKFLRHIGRNSRISQADLARATDTAPTLTGRAIEPLVERGWVRRKRSQEDRREYVLELTSSGQRMRERVDEARRQVAERIVGVLDAKDLDDFDRIATKIHAAFDRPAEELAGSAAVGDHAAWTQRASSSASSTPRVRSSPRSSRRSRRRRS